ncbi:hypothetical protein JMJ35_006485 [Cladonia borealis]|uniref:Uncharacterized protein n=1 Tax=Cladonia borealis TaxID=184061 RepID=A0AA39QXC1_9LECA|nr:hypothetical protein JMJ35_006485 [Cladonia borealis]
MSDSTPNCPAESSNTINTDDMPNRISSVINDILEQNVTEEQKASGKQEKVGKWTVADKEIQLTASVNILNTICEQSPTFRRLCKEWSDVQSKDESKDESKETAEEVKKLTRKDAWNKQGIAALRGMVKNAQKAETLVGEKGSGECEDGKGGTSGGAWKEVLKVFLEKESDI